MLTFKNIFNKHVCYLQFSSIHSKRDDTVLDFSLNLSVCEEPGDAKPVTQHNSDGRSPDGSSLLTCKALWPVVPGDCHCAWTMCLIRDITAAIWLLSQKINDLPIAWRDKWHIRQNQAGQRFWWGQAMEVGGGRFLLTSWSHESGGNSSVCFPLPFPSWHRSCTCPPKQWAMKMRDVFSKFQVLWPIVDSINITHNILFLNCFSLILGNYTFWGFQCAVLVYICSVWGTNQSN